MLKKVGTGSPVSGPRHEPNHLFSTSKVVDDSSCRLRREHTGGLERSNPSGAGSIGNDGRHVPQAQCRDALIELEVGGGEESAIGDLDHLFLLGATTAGPCNRCLSAKGRPRVNVVPVERALAHPAGYSYDSSLTVIMPPYLPFAADTVRLGNVMPCFGTRTTSKGMP
jgi:hypothetical protein